LRCPFFFVFYAESLFTNFITEKNEVAAFPVVTSSQTTSAYMDEKNEWLYMKQPRYLQSNGKVFFIKTCKKLIAL